MGRSLPDVADMTDPAQWQWVSGWTRQGGLPWPVYSSSLADAVPIASWPDHITYPQMAYDAPLHQYLLTFTHSYAPAPPEIWRAGSELDILAAPHPWGPFSFVARQVNFGPSNGYDAGFPLSWISRNGTVLWMKWAANFDGCDAHLNCSGGYGFNYRQLQLTLAPGGVPLAARSARAARSATAMAHTIRASVRPAPSAGSTVLAPGRAAPDAARNALAPRRTPPHTQGKHNPLAFSAPLADNSVGMAGPTQHNGAPARVVDLSVVIPVYACASCLVALHERLTRSIAQVTDSYELVFIDDRSRDDGWSVLSQLARADAHVRAFRLSRNFGQHAAITAGLSQARGHRAVVMDCDLQEAPEDIPRLWAAAGEGYDVVRTLRRGRRHPPLKRWASRVYRRLTLETDTSSDYSTLSLISRRVIDAFLRLRDQDREYMIALDWLGFDATTIEIDHAERHDGSSAYTLRRLVKVALDGMFFRSTVLLRVVVLVGFFVALVGVVLAGFEIIDYLVEPDKTVPGYTSLAVLLLVLAGFIIVSVGVVGLYVGRIFEQVKDRPLFLIDAQAEGPEAVLEPVISPDPDRVRTPSPDPRGS